MNADPLIPIHSSKSDVGDLVDRMHRAEARVAILESQWAAVPWGGITCLLLIANPEWIDKPEGTALKEWERVAAWLDANAPKEEQP